MPQSGLPLIPEPWRPMVLDPDLRWQEAGTGRLCKALRSEIRRGLGIRKHGDGDTHVLEEEASDFILERLPARLEKASGVSKAFLAITFSRLLDDFRDHAFGTHEPPAEVQRLGGVWIDIFRWRCQQGMELPELLSMLEQHRGLSRAEAMRYLQEVRALTIRTGCGHARAQAEDVSELSEVLAGDPEEDPLALLSGGEEEQRRGTLLMALRKRLHLTPRQVNAILASGRFERHHEPTEALVLHLCFVESLSAARVAQLLSMEPRRVQRIREDALRRLAEDFQHWAYIASES